MDEKAIWEELVSSAWVRHDSFVNEHSSVFGDASIAALALRSGESVLDVGCGTGATTARLAANVGPDGRVVGIDLSGPVIEVARSRTSALGHVEFVVGDVTTFDTDARFDALYSRNGVMFFADPVAAFAHMRTLVVEGGRLAFNCWKDPFSNPWMSVPVLASAEVLGPPDLPGPGKPGPFAFATEEIIDETLTRAGWSDVGARELSTERALPAGDATACATVIIELSPPLATGVARMPERRADLVDAVAKALVPYERDGKVVMQATAWIVTARS